jgi:GLPGLI family protein
VVLHFYESNRNLAAQIIHKMKKLYSLLLILFVSVTAFSQQAANEAIIDIKIETVFPESDAPPAPEGATVMRFGDGEMKSRLFYKNGNMKMENDMGMGKNYVFYEPNTKTTTTLMEVMGRKMGFYTNEEDMKKMAAADSGKTQQRIQAFNPEVFIEYLSETKKIAGYTCNKALIRYKNQKGDEMQQAVWYSPEIIMGEGFKFNMLVRQAGIPGIQKLKGFPMEFDVVRQNGMKIHYEVSKVDLNAKIDDKTFVIPKDFDVKPQSEMMRGGNGGFQFRVGG